MKKIILVGLVIMTNYHFGNSQFFTYDFDDSIVGATLTLSENCNDGTDDYFDVVCLSGGTCGNTVGIGVVLSGGDGGSFLGAQDTDGPPCTNVSQTASLTGINIMGQTNLTLCFEVGEDSDLGWDGNSLVSINTIIDGGGATNVTTIESSSTSANSTPGFDCNSDGLAGGILDGPLLSAVMTTYCFDIVGTGSSLDIQIAISNLSSANADIALDNFQLISTESGGILPGSDPCILACGITSFGSATETCQTNMTGNNNDNIIVMIPYMGVEDDASIVININMGTSGTNTGSDPSTDADGTISFTITEGDDYTVSLTDTDSECSFPDITGSTADDECDPCANPGDLLITEIMHSPSTGATNGEWVEVCNTTASDIDLQNFIITDGEADHTISASVIVTSGSCVVLARGDGSTICSGTPDYVWGTSGPALTTSDQFAIYCDGNAATGTLIDEVDYSSGFPSGSSASIQLDPSITSSSGNDLAGNWCTSVTACGVDSGTPGATNPACPCGITSIGPATTVCNTNTTGVDVVTVSIPYTGVQTGAIISDMGDGTPGGSDPAVDSDGTITIILNEGESWNIEITHANCTGLTSTGSIGSTECDPCPNAGDIVITEIMPDPSAVGDALGEWFEIYNTTVNDIELMGFTITSGVSNHVISTSTVIPAGGYIVLGNNATTGTNGGVTVAYEYTGIGLANTSDDISLSCDGSTIDEVLYDGTFGQGAGVSMQLSPTNLNATDNDTGTNWCGSAMTFGDGDNGTPGSANSACDCDGSATLAITEIMYDPCSGGTGDSDCTAPTVGNNWWDPEGRAEWVEIYNYGASSIDLSSYSIGDDNTSSVYTIPSGTTISAGEYLVIANETIANCMISAGINAVVGAMNFTSRFDNNPGDDITILDCSGNQIDIVDNYLNVAPWPTCAESNDGYSLAYNGVPTSATDNDGAAVWGPSLNGGNTSSLGGGSPGTANSLGSCITANPALAVAASCSDITCVSFDISFDYTSAFVSDYNIYIDGALNMTSTGNATPVGTVTETVTLTCPTSVSDVTVEVRPAGADENLCNAFELSVSIGACVLPIELIDFSVKLNRDNHVDINWQTASEINNDHFEIEWSEDGVLFQSIQSVAPKKETGASYSAIHDSPSTGYNYYRLVQYDYDNQYEVFPVRSVYVGQHNSASIALFPNPNTDNKILLSGLEGVDNDYMIYDMKGSFIQKGVIQGEVSPIELFGLERGTYIIQVVTESKTETLRFVLL